MKTRAFQAIAATCAWLLTAVSSQAQVFDTQYVSAAGACSPTTSTCATLPFVPANTGMVTYTINGTWTGTLQFEVTADGANWVTVAAAPASGGATVTSTTSTGVWSIQSFGYVGYRVHATAWSSGTAQIVAARAQGITSTGGSALVSDLTVSTGQIKVPNGSVTAPSYSFSSQPNLGIYRQAANVLGLASSYSGAVPAMKLDLGVNPTVEVPSNGLFCWSATADPTSACDTTWGRGAAGKAVLTGTTPTIQFGGTLSSFPAIKRTNAQLEFKLADDSGYALARGFQFDIGAAAGTFSLQGSMFAQATAPSAPSACGTSPTVTANNGTVAWVVTGGTGGTATGCTVTMPAATTGWNCSITNITQTAGHRADRATVQTASTTTSVTWEYQAVSTGAATAFTAGDVFRGACFAY